MTEEVFGEFGYGSGDIWVLAERMGWRKALRGKHKRDKAAGLEILEFEARYFGREPPVREGIAAPEPVARMAEWLLRYWKYADGKHRAWLERQFEKAFPDFAAEEKRRG